MFDVITCKPTKALLTEEPSLHMHTRPKMKDVKRKPKWQLAEFEALVEAYEEHYVTLNSPFSNVVTMDVKKKIYNKITDRVNAVGAHGRSVENIKSKWQNEVSCVKKKLTDAYADLKKAAHTTGGGQLHVDLNVFGDLTHLERRVAKIIP